MSGGYARAKKELLAEKTEKRGVLIVHTGPGKGKSTAAFGMILRCIGHEIPCAMIQFGKGTKVSGERLALEKFPDLVTLHTVDLGGFSWEDRDESKVADAVRQGWGVAQELLADPRFALVVLDEINVMMHRGYLSSDEVVSVLAARRQGLHVVATGRNAPKDLIEAADLVTEMTLVKHPFRDGVMAQAGVDY